MQDGGDRAEMTWKVWQIVIAFRMLGSSPTGDAMSGLLLDVASAQSIACKGVLGLSRDRASVNDKVVRHVLHLLPCCIDLECFCHTGANARGKFEFPTTAKYLQAFNGVIKNPSRRG